MKVVILAVAGLGLCAGAIYTVFAQNSATRDPAAPAAPAADTAPDPAPAAPAEPAMDPKEAATIASYGIGMNAGRSIKSDGVEVDLESFIQGIRDGTQGAKPKYTEQQVRAAFMAFQKDMQAKQEKRQKGAGDKNLQEGQAFLAKNKTKQGVKALASGLQYEVLRAGTGATPKVTDTVKVHYEGTLLNGTVFDSSIKRKEPAVFEVGGVIRGWTEALQLMKVGDKWKLYVPAELAYGPRGAGSDIGPNSMLIFEVELLGIEPPAARNALPGGGREE